MFNNSTTQSQSQVTPAGHDSSSRRTSNDTPSTELQLGTTIRDNLLTDAPNQGRGQSYPRNTYGPPIPLMPMYNFWNAAGLFPDHVPGNAAGNSLRNDGYSSSSVYGQPILPTFQSGQSADHRGIYYAGGYPPATTANPLPGPGGYSAYHHGPPPSVYSNPNAQGDPAALWQYFCRIDRAERDEIRMTIVLRRSPPA